MDQRLPIRIGVVGCGQHGRALTEAVLQLPSLQLAACADPDLAAANRMAVLTPDVSTHPSIDALLAERDVDAVLLAVPHHLLAPLALAAIRAGKHVMAEKPIALNERSAAEIEAAVSEAGICYMAGYSFRFLMGRYVHDLLAAGAIGKIEAMTGSITNSPLNTGWMAYPESGGGPCLYVASHLVDLYLWFVHDKPSAVYAWTSYRAETGADRTSVFQIQFAGGAFAQGFVTQSAPTFRYELVVYGDKGTIGLRGHTFSQFEVEVNSQLLPAYAEPTVIRPFFWQSPIFTMFVPELREFTSAIQERRSPAITVADGRRVLQVLDAIATSSRERQSVCLEDANTRRV